ncbi:hypothetical protein RJ640_015416 [Escallonia rubra]|uniref:Tyrosine decarboxylase n=1 Tax=Escallonia rubra TaxID=112253 RepID=A0AA88U8I7_9ASTE|nr:hypothetical protein RJ640_015416 [Escallonia rubra]
MGDLKLNDSVENGSVSTLNPLDHEEFRRQGHMMIDFIADYYQNIEIYPVRSQVKPGYLRERLPESAPVNPEPLEIILKDVQKDIIPGITHWQSPNFFAYFPSSGSIAGFLGEMLSTGFNTVGFNWISSPAATELESIVMDWLGKMLKLPSSFLFSGGGGGVMYASTCEAFLCTLIAIREQKLSVIGRENLGNLVVYCSDQTHFSLKKSVQIAGINPENIRPIVTTKSDNFQLCPESLRLAIISDLEVGMIPLYLCCTVGTTSSTAVDPLGPLCDVAKEYGIWVHVDAAYAGGACICPEFRHFLDGVEGANSFSFNAHKWFFTTLDCCCLWVKHPSALISALSTNPEILNNKATESKQVVDYKDWQMALSRRFRALKIWLVLRSYGVTGLSDFIRGHVKMAKHFESLLVADKRISPLAVLNNEDFNEFNRNLLESINASGGAYMVQAVVRGVYVIRLAVGPTLTEYQHVNKAFKLVQDHANALLCTYHKHAWQMGDLKLNRSVENDLASRLNCLDHEEFRRQGHMMIDFLADCYQNIEIYTFPACGSIAGFLGEMVSTGFNTVGFNWIGSRAATERESIVMDWLGKMLKLPSSFLFFLGGGGGGGVMYASTSEAFLCTPTAIREQKLRVIGRENLGKLVVYCFDQTHFSLKKLVQIAGINSEKVRPMLASKPDDF